MGSEIRTSMSELHLMMLIGYLAATSLSVLIVPNFRAGFTDERNSYGSTEKKKKKKSATSQSTEKKKRQKKTTKK